MDVVRAAPPCFDNRCPVTDVKAVFEHIAVMRMRGLPIVNPALGVEALSFRRWAGEWLGVLITPWSLSLMLLPGGGGAFVRLYPGAHQSWSFPSGEYDFIANREDGLGDYQLCSLYSPMFEFDTAEGARQTALAALRALLDPDGAPRDTVQPAPAGTTSEHAAISRRRFLRVMLPGMRE